LPKKNKKYYYYLEILFFLYRKFNMSSIIIYTTTADLDRLSIPSLIYTDTIAHNTTAIITYFENNPQL